MEVGYGVEIINYIEKVVLQLRGMMGVICGTRMINYIGKMAQQLKEVVGVIYGVLKEKQRKTNNGTLIPNG